MKQREIHTWPPFQRSLDRLAKKHQSLPKVIDDFLQQAILHGRTWRCQQIRQVDENPVFKVRIKITGVSLSRCPRLIYFCDDDRVIGLFVYTKNQRTDVPPQEIIDALNEIGLPFEDSENLGTD